MNFFKTGIFKAILILLLIVGGGVFIISIPKIFGNMLVHTIDWLTGGTEPKYDENGKMIYDDGRHTIESFGKRKEFEIWKSGTKKDGNWILFDRDKNKEIDIVRVFTESFSSPYVYTLGEKGYTKLNYETAEIVQSKSIEDFSEQDSSVFKKLEAKAKGNQEKHAVSWDYVMPSDN